MKTKHRPAPGPDKSVDLLSGFEDVVFRPRSDAPIWQQIYDHILGLIESDFLTPGSQLPGENHMAEKLGVTRITLRRALQQLQREGHLTARKGVGIFVRSLPSVFTVRDDRPFLENFHARGKEIVTQTLVLCRETVTTAVAKKLQLAEDVEIIRLCRIRSADGQPLYVNTKIVSGQPLPELRSRLSATPVRDRRVPGAWHRQVSPAGNPHQRRLRHHRRGRSAEADTGNAGVPRQRDQSRRAVSAD